MHNTGGSYQEIYAEFRWGTPENFNFAVDVVDHWAEDEARLALVWRSADGARRELSFADIAAASKRLGALLLDGGIEPGDKVIVMLPRVPEWQVALTACLRIGAIPVPCVTMLTATDIAYRVNHSDAKGAITTTGHIEKFADLDGLAVRVAVGDAPPGWIPLANSDRYPAEVAPATVSADDPAIMYYTSGSTGGPKGVVHAARALWAWRFAAKYWLSLRPGDLMWCTADTGWSKAGTSVLFGPWSVGAAALFYDGAFEAARRFDLLKEERVNVFCAAATELRQLIKEPRPVDLPELRLTVSAGESVNPEIIHRWHRLAGTDLLDGYGQTETLMTVTNMTGMPVKPGSMGRPLPGVIAGALTAETTVLDRSAAGQLVIQAPNPQLFLGYYDDDQRTSSSYVELAGVRWFLTGDNVDIDADGYYFYVGRSDDIINSAGYRIGPQEVENVLIGHRAVQECAVVGAPDPERGEIVVAFVVPARGAEPGEQLTAELQEYAKKMTAPYKYPRRIEYVDELIKTVTGKIRRGELRARLRSTATE